MKKYIKTERHKSNLSKALMGNSNGHWKTIYFDRIHGLTKKRLTKLYIEKRLSSIDIARILGISKGVVLKRLEKYGFSRGSAEAQKNRFSTKGDILIKKANNYDWLEKRIDGGGYVRVYDPKTGVTKLEHRRVIEGIIGRKLLDTEVVHHKNGDKTDNKIINLEIMDKKAHSKLHKNIDKYYNKKRG